MCQNEVCEKQKSERSVKRQILLGLLTNFSSIAPSMSLGFSAVAIPALVSITNPNALTDNQASWFASIASLATPFGCFFAGPIADRYGRKTALFCVNLTCFLGWIVIAAAHFFSGLQFPILLLGRILTGLSTGLSSVPATIYMAEISSPKLRGVFTTWSSISFAIGVLIIYMLGYALKDSWMIMALFTAVFPCIGILLNALFIPESPSWLIAKNRVDEAKLNMCYVFGVKESNYQVEQEIESLIKTKTVKNGTNKSPMSVQLRKKIKMMMKPAFYNAFVIVVVFFFFQQFSGTFSIVFYAISIVENAGVKFDPYLAIVLIGVVRMFSAILLSYITKKFGRRPLAIFSGLGMSVCMLVLGGYILLIEQGKVSGDVQSKLLFLPVLLLLLYFFTSTLGFLPLPFAFAAEVFPTKLRGTATGLSSGIGYFFNFITVKIYPAMVGSMYKQGVFFFYGAISFIGTIFVLLCLPETKGKSLADIEEYFGGKKVRRKENEVV
ncbi:unnamed protein product [Brassicogethes aeneus]|uniref:Major facilitator superfamily (MFS) profile domain-containing protein n=1 Tax=Brassicogethes aeneus TaxID=1431903 RepID=A0A9P0AWZ4_BRAAE|nr:unnamed protein product [Brassicogethes aeneus]